MSASHHIILVSIDEATWWEEHVNERKLPFFYSLKWLRQFESAGKIIRLLILKNHSDEPLLAWPVHINKKLGCTRLLLPPLTPYGGPIFIGNLTSDQKLRIIQCLNEWLNQNMDWAQARFSASLSAHPHINVSKLIQQDTLVISPQLSPANRFKEYDKQHRYDIRRAEREGLMFSNEVPAEVIFRLWKSSLRHQNHSTPLSKSLFDRVMDNSKNSSNPWRTQSMGILNSSKEWAAVLVLFYDESTAYLLISGLNRTASKFAAGALLLHKAIEWCHEQKLMLDLEGSQVPGVRQFYQKFNPDVRPIQKYQWGPSVKLKALNRLSNLFNKSLYQ